VSDVTVTPVDEGRVAVEVVEGQTRTSHVVSVPQELLDDLVLDVGDVERLVWESFQFLLEREKATSILPEFSLEQIGDYFPEYRDDIAARVAT
jgi:hypothetical protein